MPLLLQVIPEIAQAFIIAFGATIAVDYLKNGPIESFWMIMGIIMMALILVKAFKLKSN